MQRVQAALISGVRGATVERNRRAEITADDAVLLVLHDGSHTALLTDFQDTAYQMQLTIDAAVTGEYDEDVGPSLNALYAQVIEALMVDPTLGGIAVQIREDGLGIRVATIAESQQPLGFFSLDVTVEFRTGDGQPYVSG